MDLSELPAELVEAVAEYLSVEDVLACSGVNRQWRSAFDINRIWRRFCTFHPQYFKKQEAQVKNTTEYNFEGCLSKKNFFKEIIVERNLAQSRLHVEQIHIGSFYCDSLLDSVDDAGNHWLFISCSDSFDFESCHQLKVWNMNKKPILHKSVETVLGKTRRILDSKMKTIKDKLYYMLNDTVLVFNFCYPTYEITFISKVSLPCESLSQMVCLSNVILGFLYTATDLQFSPPSVHVWDENGSLKIKKYSVTQYPLIAPGVCPYLKVKDGSSDNVLVVFNCSLYEYNYSVLLFNVKSLQYTELFVFKGSVEACDIVNDRALLCYKDGIEGIGGHVVIKCFNMSAKCLCYRTELHPINVLNSILFVVNESCKEILILSGCGEVTVFNVFQHKASLKFTVDRTTDLTGTILNSNLVIIQKRRKNPVIHEIWNYKLGKKLFAMNKFYPLGYGQYFFSFSILKGYRSPPKIFAIKDPQSEYAHMGRNGKVLILSAW